MNDKQSLLSGISPARCLLDFLFILIFCCAFGAFKTHHFYPGADMRAVLGTGGMLFGVWDALTCYPAYFIGIRKMNSPLAFFAISWCAVVTMILLSLTLSQGMTYYVGYAPVYLSGKLTWFGLYYELLTPRLAFAIFSTALIALYLFKPIRL